MTDPQQVLTVEDDAAIRRGIVDALRFAGYVPLEAACGNEGLRLALRRTYDLLLLDLVLPGKTGLEILQAVRDAKPTQPVIILTAKGEESDRVSGLRLGADDYVVKPFSVKELLARVEAVLRRSPQRPSRVSSIPIPGGTIDLARREARFDDGQRVDLAERELGLIEYLASHAGRAITREEILASVWQIDARRCSTRTIDMHVARLREKLRDDRPEPQILLTVRGKGYMFGQLRASGT
ncbi:MAG: response regulator transcription factor [Pirellulales bacterium]